MTRRTLIELAARAAALPAGAEFLRAWAQAPPHPHSTAPAETALPRNYQPKFFDAADFEALEAFTAILIPTDDTPGAREARSAHFIDFVLASSDGFAPDVQKQWRDALKTLKDAGFHTSDAAGRAALVAAISEPADAAHPAYRLIRQQNIFAFYTSRAGMIEALDYRGNSYNETFPACTHPEHQRV